MLAIANKIIILLIINRKVRRKALFPLFLDFLDLYISVEGVVFLFEGLCSCLDLRSDAEEGKFLWRGAPPPNLMWIHL